MQGNTSDHLPIVLQYNFIPNEKFGKFLKEIKPKLPTLDHESQHIIHQYSSLVQTKLNDCCKKQLENLKRSNTPEDVVQQTTDLLKQITTHLLDSATTLKRNQPKPNLPSNKTKRTRKPWWDEVLYKLHNDVCITYVLYRDSDFNERLKEHFAKAKTNFRKYRRYREKLHHNSKLRELNRLFGISSNGFWKYMKQMQRLKQLITCELKDIRAAYAKTFTERNKFNLDENKVKNELNEFIQKAKTQNSNQQMSFKLERETLITAISSLKNGKAKGTSGVSNEMI